MDSFEYTCVGRADAKKAMTIVCLSVASCVLLGIASVEDTVFAPYFKGASSVFLFLGILLAVRFVGTRYSYSIILYPSGEGDLVMNELRGYFGKETTVKVRRTVCRVSVADIRETEAFKNDKNGKKRRRKLRKEAWGERAAVYNYCADVFPESYAVIKISDRDGTSYVKFSPDEKLLSLLEGELNS